MAYRVIQWATGHVGVRALRAIARHPDLELVGVCVSSREKAGRDAGEIAGVAATGVRASADPEEVLRIQADCVCYAAASDTRLGEAVDDMCRILESGRNLVTTSFVPLVYPPTAPAPVSQRLEAACRAGGSSFYCSGIDPGFASDALPIVLSSLSERIDRIRCQEIFDYASYDQPETLFDTMGFGRPPGHPSLLLAPGMLVLAWGGSLRMLADALGVKLDEMRQSHEVAVAEESFEIACGTIEAGSVAGLHFEVQGIIGGEPRIVIEHVTRLRDDVAPQWPRGSSPGTYRVLIDGMPSLRCELEVGVGSDDHNLDGCTAAAMRVVNAIPWVCRAEPGLKSWLDLPGICGWRALR